MGHVTRIASSAATALRRLRPTGEQLVDVAFLAGLAAIAAGCGWIFPPTAPIVGGGFLAVVAWHAGHEPAPPAETRQVERWYTDDVEDES